MHKKAKGKIQMDLKKRLKAFFTLTGKSDGGFTLVELIVVIAILAILAGVGTAGYSGYIRAANKGNDKTLVGNIMRAIETGTNSYAFVSDDSFKMGSISYPVGIVVVSADGTTVISSKTPQANANVGECKFQNIIVSYPVEKSQEASYCETDNSKTKKVYEWKSESLSCCVTHTSWLAAGADSGKATSYAKHECQTREQCGTTTCSSYTATATNLTASGEYCVSDKANICGASSEAGLCQVGYANQYGTFDTPQVGNAYTGDPIYDALVAAFGSDFASQLKLTYDGWNEDEGFGYVTFYSNGPALLDRIESLSGTLINLNALASLASKDLGLAGDYEDAEDVLLGVSSAVNGKYQDETAWLEVWNDEKNLTWDSTGFGFDKNDGGRESYSAVRMAYNEGFASYMEANNMGTYAGQIRNFYSQSAADYGISGVDLGLPGLVCTDAFTDSASPLTQNLKNAGATDEDIQAIQDLYAKYVETGDCAENGKAFYNMVDTFDQTSDVAGAYSDLYDKDAFDYYGGYIAEISAMYKAAQDAAGDGIVIIVTIETIDGRQVVSFQVSPGAASPRND